MRNSNFSTHNLKILICIFLAIANLSVFWQTQNHDFVNFDDSIYILDNQHVKSGLNLKNVSWAFTTLHGGFWFPLTWLSHMLDSELYGINPKGHHFNNLLLHIVNSILLFLLLNRMTGALWRSAFVAALFALHPLHVEPVAWVSSRKDVLSTLFWILTIWFYVYYTKNTNLKRYLIVILFFTLGLMSKPMLVTLPFVLLLLDYWPLKRISFDINRKRILPTLIMEKIPLLALSIIFSFLIYFAERHYGALPSFDSYPLATRFANALTSYIHYIYKMIWPHNLAFFYPHQGMPQWWIISGAGLLLLFITFYSIKSYRNHPYLIVGWLWYLGTLVPVIGFIQIGSHGMADRYTYIPLIGIFIMITWRFPAMFRNYRFKNETLGIAGGTLVLLLMILSWFQVQVWQNSITLFKHAIKTTSDNYVAHNNLGIALVKKGELDDALLHFSEALNIKPDNLESLNNMGAILARLERFEEAILFFSRLLQVTPNSAGTNLSLGIALQQQGNFKEAASHFNRALELKPDSPEAHFNLGIISYKEGKYKESVSHFSKTLYIEPGHKKAQDYLPIAQIKAGSEGIGSAVAE